MVEGTGLENRRTRKGIESSNLSLSVFVKVNGLSDLGPFCFLERCNGVGLFIRTGGRVV